MNALKPIIALGLATAVAGCDVGPDKSLDRGIDADNLSTMVAGVWVDPNGCDHWIIDDGLEGYLSERLQPDGTPVCSGVASPETAVGPFKDGSPIPDPL